LVLDVMDIILDMGPRINEKKIFFRQRGWRKRGGNGEEDAFDACDNAPQLFFTGRSLDVGGPS